ncbi:MAG: polysaccharide pyruvyl transferase family protein [Eubacteriales bacterium]
MGEEAALHALVYELKTAGIGPVVVLSAAPKKTARALPVAAIHRRAVRRLSRLLSPDAVFLWAGETLPPGRRLWLYDTALFLLAKRKGAFCCLYACGIGVLRGARTERRVRAVLAAADAVTLRTPADQARAIELGAAGAAPVCDPALLLRQQTDKEGAPCLIVSLSGRMPRHRQRAYAALIRLIHEQHCLLPLFVPLCTRGDRRLNRRVHRWCSLGSLCSPNSPEELVSLLACARFSMGSRVRLSVLSLSAGIPCLFTGEGEDARAWLEELGALTSERFLSGVLLHCPGMPTPAQVAQLLAEKPETVREKTGQIKQMLKNLSAHTEFFERLKGD